MTHKKKHPVNLHYKHINEVLTDMIRDSMPGVTPQSADLYYHDEVIVAPMVCYTDERMSGFRHCLLVTQPKEISDYYAGTASATASLIITDTPRPDEYYLADA